MRKSEPGPPPEQVASAFSRIRSPRSACPRRPQPTNRRTPPLWSAPFCPATKRSHQRADELIAAQGVSQRRSVPSAGPMSRGPCSASDTSISLRHRSSLQARKPRTLSGAALVRPQPRKEPLTPGRKSPRSLPVSPEAATSFSPSMGYLILIAPRGTRRRACSPSFKPGPADAPVPLLRPGATSCPRRPYTQRA